MVDKHIIDKTTGETLKVEDAREVHTLRPETGDLLGGLQGRPDPKHVQGYRQARGIWTELRSVRKTVVDNDSVRAHSRDDGDGVRLAVYDPVSNDIAELRLDGETFRTLLKTCIEMAVAHHGIDQRFIAEAIVAGEEAREGGPIS